MWPGRLDRLGFSLIGLSLIRSRSLGILCGFGSSLVAFTNGNIFISVHDSHESLLHLVITIHISAHLSILIHI
jgi:hypothetical protein